MSKPRKTKRATPAPPSSRHGDIDAFEMRPLAKITPYDNNPRDNAAAVDAVAKSIETFGFRNPILIDSDGVIIAGDTRYRAAKKIGLKAVPVIIARDLSPEQVRAYRIADNKTAELATWNKDLLAQELKDLVGAEIELDWTHLGFEQDELDEILVEDPPTLLKTLDIKAPPKMTWALIGIPTVRFGEINQEIERIAAVPDVICEMSVADEQQQRNAN